MAIPQTKESNRRITASPRQLRSFATQSSIHRPLGAASDRLPVDAGIGALLAVEAILTRAAVEKVVAFTSLDPVVTLVAEKLVLSVVTFNVVPIGAAADEVVILLPAQQIVSSQTAQHITASAPQDHIVPGGADDGVMISRPPAESIGDAVDRAALAGPNRGAHAAGIKLEGADVAGRSFRASDPPLVGGRWGTAGPHGIDGRTAAHQGAGQGGPAVGGEGLENAANGDGRDYIGRAR